MTGEQHGHLTPLGSGEFSVWRTMEVRAAGLPFHWVSRADTVREKPFQEALTWQHTQIAAHARQVAAGERDERKLHRTLAAYRARYCAKNDTIGFFGPHAFGQWREGPTNTGEFDAPPPRGSVFFEVWAIQGVGDALADRYRLHPWMVPHLASAVLVVPDGVHLGDGSLLPLSGPARCIVEAVDGFRTAGEIVAECSERHPTEDTAAELRSLQGMGVLTSGFFIPQTRHPERVLGTQLARVGDEELRAAATGELASLVRARDGVTDRLGDPDAVDAALTALNQRFTEVTQRSSRRRDGEYYAGRNIVYEDCVSTFTPSFSMGILQELALALELVLRSARWFSQQVAEGYLTAARELLASDPSLTTTGCPLAGLLQQLAPTFYNSDTGPAADAAAELRRRWTEVLGAEPGGAPVVLNSADLSTAVQAAFPAHGPGWPSARWHSPDLLFAAAGPAELREGRYLAVLGELHPTMNTLDNLSTFASHHDQRAMRCWIDADMPYRIAPLYPTRGGMMNSRTAPPEAHHAAHYTYLGVTGEPSYAPRQANVLPVGGLRVRDLDGELVVTSLDGSFQAGLVAVLDEYLALSAFNRFGLMEPAAHRPRVQIDKLVVSRESWQVPLTEFPDIRQGRLDRVCAHVRDAAQRHGLPETAFWRVPGEVKPAYVDLADEALLDSLWAMMRRGRERRPEGVVTVTELLPGPEGLWLHDAQGRRYTVEVRTVCVDGQQFPRTEGIQ